MKISSRMSYSQKVEKIGHHWTFHMSGSRLPNCEVLVPVEVSEGDSNNGHPYFNAKYAAQNAFVREFGKYPDRSDICSSPIENLRMECFPPGLDENHIIIATVEDRCPKYHRGPAQ